MELNPTKYLPTRKAFSLFDEFKAFALKGNVIDLAVGVIIGAAFGAIVSSLVKDIIMPLISAVMPGDMSYTSWTWVIKEPLVDAAGNVVPGTGKVVPYGKFLGEVVNFVIVAFALFIFIVKFLGWVMKMKKKEVETGPIAPPAPTKEEILLTEIRDLLKARQ
jgi:large conductance mechanosensitive channel